MPFKSLGVKHSGAFPHSTERTHSKFLEGDKPEYGATMTTLPLFARQSSATKRIE